MVRVKNSLLFAVLVALNFAGTFADKPLPSSAPIGPGGYDQQSSGGQGGYKTSVFLGNAEVKNPTVPSQSYGVQPSVPSQSYGVQGGSSGVINYDFQAANSLTQGKDFQQHNNFGVSSFAATSGGGGYGGAVDSSQQGYGPPSSSYQPASQPTYGDSQVYHYTHYPAQRPNNVSPGDEGSFFDSFGDLGGGLGGGLGALGGLGGAGGLIAIAKGLLALKPLLIFGLLLLLAVPLLLLFLPIPIITVSNLPSLVSSGDGQRARGPGGQSMLTSYLSQISDRVLNAEECLERIVCKMPQVPRKYQGKAKILWEQYGKKYFSSSRVQRALSAYFDESTGRARISKCNQKFKCSHKFL